MTLRTSLIKGLLPVWGAAATLRSIKPLTALTGWIRSALTVPLSWAFTRREGSPDVSDTTPDDVDDMNRALNRGSELIHRTPADAVASINTAFADMTTALTKAPAWLRVGELDIVGKLSIQRRFPPTWYLPAEPPPLAPPTKEYRQVASSLLRWYAKQAAKLGLLNRSPLELAAMDTDPHDTNAGWPLFSSQIDEFMAVISNLDFRGAKWPDEKGWIDSTTELAQNVGVPGSMFMMGVSRRARPTRKPLPIYNLSGDQPLITAESIACYTGPRVVYMASRILNIALSPIHIPVKMARLTNSGFSHTAEDRRVQITKFADYEASGKRIIESDFSAFDTTFTPEHRGVIYGAMEAAGFDRSVMRMLRNIDERGAFLTPLWGFPRGGEAEMVTGRFGLFSGIKETSNLGSIHAQIIVLKSMVRAKMTSLADIEGGNWPLFLNLGDDVLLAANDLLTPAAYEEAAAEEGIKAKLLDGRRMLMRHLEGGKEYAVGARVLQQTLGNEDSYRHLGHVVLGLAARLLIPLHPSIEGDVLDILRATVTGELADVIKTVGLKASDLLRHPSVGEFLTSNEGQSWLDDASAQLDVRPAISEMLEAAAVAGHVPNIHGLLTDRAQLLRIMLAPPTSLTRAALHEVGNRIVYA